MKRERLLVVICISDSATSHLIVEIGAFLSFLKEVYAIVHKSPYRVIILTRSNDIKICYEPPCEISSVLLY